MVVVILNSIQFEAEKFESRTMPTPNLKGKEMIYWIKVATEDKRLATELQKFLEGAAHYIDLKVPSAFVSTKTELESFKVVPSKESMAQGSLSAKGRNQIEEDPTGETNHEKFRIEIILRRTLPETPPKMTQSPYG